MIYTGGDFRFLSQVRLGDILVVETYFYWSNCVVSPSADTFCFSLFPGSKERCRHLTDNAQAYLDWIDFKGSFDLIRPRAETEFIKKTFFPAELIVDQFASLVDGRLLSLGYAEFDSEWGFPNFVECYYVY